MADRGFEVPTIVFTPTELAAIAERGDESFGTRRGALRLAAQGRAVRGAIEKIEAAVKADESARVGGRAVHLLLGENYHEAKLTNSAVEKLMGVATNRNLKVIRTLAEKWGERSPGGGRPLAAEVRLPLLPEGAHPLGDVVGAQQDGLPGALALERGLELVEGGGVDRLLGGGVGEGGARRQPADDLVDERRELGVGAPRG